MTAINSGAVYPFPLKAGQNDTSGTAINSAWVPVHMGAVPRWSAKISSSPMPSAIPATSTDRQPRQSEVLGAAARALHWRGFATHVLNFLWAYNVDSGSCPGCSPAWPGRN